LKFYPEGCLKAKKLLFAGREDLKRSLKLLHVCTYEEVKRKPSAEKALNAIALYRMTKFKKKTLFIV
jgi:hypothetical protein